VLGRTAAGSRRPRPSADAGDEEGDRLGCGELWAGMFLCSEWATLQGSVEQLIPVYIVVWENVT